MANPNESPKFPRLTPQQKGRVLDQLKVIVESKELRPKDAQAKQR
jgi:hypothetical protein